MSYTNGNQDKVGNNLSNSENFIDFNPAFNKK